MDGHEIFQTLRLIHNLNVATKSLKYSVNSSHLGENMILLWPLGIGFKRLSVDLKSTLGICCFLHPASKSELDVHL